MKKTVALVTNQHCCDRIINAARLLADESNTELVVMGVQDSEYELNPEAIEYLFGLAKQNRATMRLLFSSDKEHVISNMVGRADSLNIVTGMPGDIHSVLYDIWKKYPSKQFYTVDEEGAPSAVLRRSSCTA